MNITVFSKDRACQLELFLRGFFNLSGISRSGISVIYTASNLEYENGYNLLRKIYQDVRWIYESDFKKDILKSIKEDNTLTVFFTDDDIWLRKFDLNHPTFGKFYHQSNKFSCFSLRLNPNLTYCYAFGKPILDFDRPKFEKNNAFRWFGLSNDYGYPMSLDGHVFKTLDILPLLYSLRYQNPNTLEVELHKHPLNRPYMSCFDESVIVNNPCNRVQSVISNKNEGIDPFEMNEQFLKGKRLSDKHILGQKITAVHQPFPIIYDWGTENLSAKTSG